jgi:hypothetical protein
MAMRAIGCGTLALLTVTTANAQTSKSANDVLRDCKRNPSEVLVVDDNSSREFFYCMGAIDGLVVGRWKRLASARTAGTSEGSRYLEDPLCFDVPDKAFIERETLKVIIRYADSHPVELTEPFVQVAARALREAWPCKK